MKSTFSRQVSTTVLILLLALLLLGGAFRILVGQYLEHNTHDQLQTDALALAELVAAYDAANDLQHENLRTNLTLASLVSGADTVVMDSLGNVILCSEPGLQCPHLGLTINQNFVDQVFENGSSFDTGTIPELYAEIRYYVSVPIVSHRTGSNIGLVTVSMPTGDTQALMEGIADIQVTVSLLVILIAVVIMSVSTRNECRPLREMAQAARDFGHGNLKARVRTGGHNSEEVDELAVAFNNMAESLEKSEYQRQEFVANVSHELKTPMTTIGGYIDGILDGTIPQERHRNYLRIVSDETKRLNRLVRSMLDISRLQDQGGIPEEKKSRFDLTENVGQVLITFEQKILSKKLDVQVEMPEHSVDVFACQDYIVQVIYNLIDNAVKFCPEGGLLGLRITEGGGKAYVSVRNEGETIPAEELPLVFDRFHKMDKSRSQNREGWGLGLYIVKTIICSHGEDISVTSGGGVTEFTFTLPLMN